MITTHTHKPIQHICLMRSSCPTRSTSQIQTHPTNQLTTMHKAHTKGKHTPTHEHDTRTNIKLARRNPKHAITQQLLPNQAPKHNSNKPIQTTHHTTIAQSPAHPTNTTQGRGKGGNHYKNTHAHQKQKKPVMEETKGYVVKEQPNHFRKIEPTSITVQGKPKDNNAT